MASQQVPRDLTIFFFSFLFSFSFFFFLFFFLFFFCFTSKKKKMKKKHPSSINHKRSAFCSVLHNDTVMSTRYPRSDAFKLSYQINIPLLGTSIRVMSLNLSHFYTFNSIAIINILRISYNTTIYYYVYFCLWISDYEYIYKLQIIMTMIQCGINQI